MNVVEILIEVTIFTAIIGSIASQVANPDGNLTGAEISDIYVVSCYLSHVRSDYTDCCCRLHYLAVQEDGLREEEMIAVIDRLQGGATLPMLFY